MRNTDQYPITLNEMIDACHRASADILKGWEQHPEDMPIGDITPMALQEAANRLKRLQFAAQEPFPKNLRTYNRKPPARAALRDTGDNDGAGE